MRVLVTGGAGFIGSWTVEALITGGHDVLVYDSFVTGRSENLRGASVDVVRGDICQPLALQRTVRRFRPHAIIHLAACVSVPLSLRRALRSHDDNTRGTLAVLEAARANEVRRVVLASSCAVYGRTTAVPLAEDVPAAPLSPYALHKRMGEDYARLYCDLYGLETVALRYFNVFGPRQEATSPYSGVIARFVDAARNGRPVTITGDGTQTRDFVFVADVARANVAALTADLTGHHVVNVARGCESSLLELHAAIEALTNRPLPYVLAPPRAGDVLRSCADVTRLRDLLGLTCSTSLHDGLTMLLVSEGVRARVLEPVTV
jgi:UDP-glucose 4-epimerase